MGDRSNIILPLYMHSIDKNACFFYKCLTSLFAFKIELFRKTHLIAVACRRYDVIVLLLYFFTDC